LAQQFENLAVPERETRAPLIVAVETVNLSLEADRTLAVHGAHGLHSRSDFLFVRLSTDSGVAGFGEVSARPLWSGEDATTARHLIREVLGPALVGARLRSVPELMARLDRVLAGNPFTKAGVSMALWDALGRITGLRVTELLGGPFRDRVPVKMSLSGDGARLEACYKAARAHGFRSFKVKVGLDVDADIERFGLARELAGQATFIGADANGGWTRSAARLAIPQLHDLGAAFIEQPVRAGDIEGLAALRGLGLPVLADESLFSLDDVSRIVRARAADAASVYVGKSGGLERAVRAVQTLDLFGIDALIGSNNEMGLGAAAQIHVACACERLAAIPSDIIGHHYYSQDILATPARIDGVHAFLPEGPGLGVDLVAEIQEQFS
jgi:L-alanine-DL-glutamate epimerase-like enolase superfamily enzyme